MMWTIRKANGEEDEEILRLHNLVHKKPKTRDEYVWLYHRNPSGPSHTWLAVDEENGIMLSARPVFPWRIKILDSEVIATQAGDAMTHPDYRRLGIFTELVKAAWSELGERGIPFTYSFSIEASRSIYRKVRLLPGVHTGYHEIGLFRRMVKHLRFQKLLVSRLGSNLLSKCVGRALDILVGLFIRNAVWPQSRRLTIKEIRQFDWRFDLLWERASKSYKVVGIRDSKFLNWRYIDTPKKLPIVLSAQEGEEVLGYAVFEIMQSANQANKAYLIEVFGIPDFRIARSLVTGVIKYCYERNVSQIDAWALEESEYGKMLRKRGFIRRPDHVPLVVHIHMETPYTELLLDAKNWFISLGDRDIETMVS